MEKYRDTLNRYSTGQGFSVNVDVPDSARKVAAYQMLPLDAKHIGQSSAVDLKREASRLSIQVESANRQLLTLGYDPVAGRRYRELKNRVDALRHLISSYPIRLIRMSDLALVYKHFKNDSPQLDTVIQKVIKYNRGGSDVFTKTAAGLRKGYPLYDKFGEKLSSGLGQWTTNRTLTIVGIAAIAYFLIRHRII